MRNILFLLVLIFLSVTSNNLKAQIPNAPTNLHLIYIYTSAAEIKWNDNSNNENGFIIERSLDGFNWQQKSTVSANTVSYLDLGLIINTKYYYRVCAFNSSGNSAYSNVIVAAPLSPFLCSIGSDTISTPYPFYTTSTDSRTQMLYRRSEMTGFCNVGYIWAISFFYNGTSQMTINNCTIKMQSTTDTVMTSYINSGWTTVYNQSLTFYSQGWRGIDLSPTFIADINKNLLIEICFHSPVSLTNNIIIRSSIAPNKTIHRNSFNGNGCSLDSGIVYNYRPNLQIVNIIDGVRRINEAAPSKYSLAQNYPNPFNGDTKFRFTIKNYGPVTLSLYDVLGRQEVVVFSEPLAPGEYEKIFSLRDHPLPSGIYYYCMTTSDFVAVKRLVILK